jgi:hypothetical protein
MKKILTLCLCLITGMAFSQNITRMVWLDKEEIEDLSKRKLVLCAYTESDFEIARLTKKLEKTKDEKKQRILDRIAYHESMNTIFKDGIKALVQENWHLNSTDKLEIKTYEELAEMRKNKKGSDMAVLMIRFFQLSQAEYNPSTSSIDLPAMTLQGIEHFGKNNNHISFPLLYSNTNRHCRKDAALTIKLLEKLVKANIAAEKRMQVEDFVQASVKENCAQKTKMETIINEDLLKNTEISEVKEAYGNKINPLSNDEFIAAYEGKEGTLAAVCLPANIVEDAMLPITYLLFGRLVINTETAEIVGYSDYLVGEKAGQLMFKKNHFQFMGKCK